MKTLYESILDDEDKLINRAANTFKNWIACISCNFYERNWSDDEILKILNSDMVMRFFPMCKNYVWKPNNLSRKYRHRSFFLYDNNIMMILELNTNNALLRLFDNTLSDKEIKLIETHLKRDCNMKLNNISYNKYLKHNEYYFAPNENEYYKDYNKFK